MSTSTPAGNSGSASNLLNTTTYGTPAGRAGSASPSTVNSSKIDEPNAAHFDAVTTQSREQCSTQDHLRRLVKLRAEAQKLSSTDWQYESVETLLGN